MEAKSKHIHIDLSTLTPREKEVLGLIVRGLTDREIASRLGIVQGTANLHRAHIKRKTGCKNSATLALLAVCAGLVDPCNP